MKFDVLNRWSGEVQFSAEIDCAEDASTRIKVGLAVRWGYANGASLDGASLDGASLVGASLDGARLVGARLVGASLVGASLDGASLAGASLVGASLVGARLDGASLDGARLDQFIVDGKFGIVLAGMPNNWHAFGYVDEESQTIRVRVGCRHFEIGEGRGYWSAKTHPERKNRREVLAALDYIEAVMRLRGWETRS
jgi:Pentapeptide repeats (8 copies)